MAEAPHLDKKPIDPDRVLKILECRRRIADFVESMLEQDIELDQLRAGETLICQADFDDIVQERYILKLCGYPLCSNKLTKEWRQRYHLSLKDRRIYDVEVRKLYCSVNCMERSKKYRDENLPQQPIWMRLEGYDINVHIPLRRQDSNELR